MYKDCLVSVMYTDVDLSDNFVCFPFWEIISVLCSKEKVESVCQIYHISIDAVLNGSVMPVVQGPNLCLVFLTSVQLHQ